MKTHLPATARAARSRASSPFPPTPTRRAIFTPNNQPTGWVGEVDVSGFDFTDGVQTIFKGDYIKGDWSGNLSAFPVDADGTVLLRRGALERRCRPEPRRGRAATRGRRIVTMKRDGTKIPFRWASLDTHAAVARSATARARTR